MWDADTFFTFGRAALYGFIAIVGCIVTIQKSSGFRRRWYWWLLFIAFGNSLLRPFVYMWTTSYNVSLPDAILLRTFHAGSWRVAEGYSIFVGLAVGGLIGFSLLRLNKGKRSD